jgi:hypothetical protein
MRGKILKYAKTSDIMNVAIRYGREKFSFNLYEEIVIDENIITEEAKNQPTNYAFLTMLHKKLTRYCKDLELEMKKEYSKQMEKIRSEKDPSTGRPPSKDVCDVKIQASPSYQEKCRELISAEHNAEVIKVCVTSFEQRKDILQTISANLRKEQ